jgi:anaerobic selenocysteine-containing dehydrogenase
VIAILIAITGHLEGGNIFHNGFKKPATKPLELMERYTPKDVDNLVGYEFPKEFQPFIEGTSSSYTRLFQSVFDGERYKIRAIIAPGSQPILHIKPDAARERGIKTDDWIMVESPLQYESKSGSDTGLQAPDTVMLLHGWWTGCEELGISDLSLTDGGVNVNAIYTF